MPHQEYVSRLSCCDTVLDLVKPGASCCSLRVCEAVAYHTRLLTNNPLVKKLPYYAEDSIAIFSEPSEINLDFCKKKDQPVYPNANAVSPMGFLEFLDCKLKDKSDCE